MMLFLSLSLGFVFKVLKEEHRLRSSENWVLRSDEVAGGRRKYLNGDLHNLNSSPNIIRVIKSNVMRCAGHVALLVDMRIAYKILVAISKRKTHSEDLAIDSITLKRILRKSVLRQWIGFIWLRVGTSG
jgi:hypothetical protein